MTEPGSSSTPGLGAPEKSPLSLTFSVLMQFVLVPLVIVGVLVAFFVLGGVILGGGDEPEDYLNKVRTGSGRESWQAAYELSVLLARDEKARKDPELARQVILAFRDSGGKAPEIRRYLVLAMGQLRTPEAAPALLEALQDNDPETRGYAAWALGASETREAIPGLVPLLSDADPGLRKVAAFALGHLKATEAIPDLEGLLNDPQHDVRWNAALALARIGSPSGLPVLHRMLDRAYLGSVPDLSDEQRQEAMINAMRAAGLLKNPESRALIDELSRSDEDIKVQRAALELLEGWPNP